MKLQNILSSLNNLEPEYHESNPLKRFNVNSEINSDQKLQNTNKNEHNYFDAQYSDLDFDFSSDIKKC